MSANPPNPTADTKGCSVKLSKHKPGHQLSNAGFVPSGPAGGDAIKSKDMEQVYSLMDMVVKILGKDPADSRKRYNAILNSIQTDDEEVKSIAASEYVNCPKTSCSRSNKSPGLASRADVFTAWASEVGLFPFNTSDNAARSEIEGIKSMIKYPEALKLLETSIDIQEPNMQHFVASVKAWARNPLIPWDNSPNIPRLWGPLLNNWSHTKNAVDNRLSEETQRELVDAMLHLVFYQSVKQSDEHNTIRLEAELALPRSSAGASPVSVKAKADAVILKEAPDDCQIKISKALAMEGIAMPALFQCLVNSPKLTQIGAFALETKRDDSMVAERQLELDLCSMQFQRRMLSLENKTVYGATCVRGVFLLYASMWIEEGLACMPLNSCKWKITNPAQFVECLYFLLALKRHLDESLKDDFNSIDVGKLCASIQQGPIWRSETIPKRPWKGEGSESSSKRTRSDKERGNQNTESVIDGDDNNSNSGYDVPYTHHPITTQDVLTHWPYIHHQLLNFSRVEDWQKTVASSEHENTLAHDDGEIVMGK
ncbi:hypothetical protein ACEPAG_2707 [Sanghuangporus baumii]